MTTRGSEAHWQCRWERWHDLDFSHWWSQDDPSVYTINSMPSTLKSCGRSSILEILFNDNQRHLKYRTVADSCKYFFLVSIYCSYCLRVTYVNSFRSRVNSAHVWGHFGTTALNNPQNTLNTERSTVHNASQLSNFSLFIVRPTDSELQVILRQVHCIMAKWHWTFSSQKHPICAPDYSIDESLTGLSFALRPPLFSYKSLWDKYAESPSKWPWTLSDPRYTIYVLLVSPSPKVQSVSLYGLPFPS